MSDKCIYPFPCECKQCLPWLLMKPTINKIREEQEKTKKKKKEN